jgi:hypothetical protein
VHVLFQPNQIKAEQERLRGRRFHIAHSPCHVVLESSDEAATLKDLVAPNQAEIHQRQAANDWRAMLEADAARQENV